VHGPGVLGLDPSGSLLEAWGLGDSADGLDRFVDIAIAAADGSVAVVKPQSAFYERHGWEGIRALARLVEGCRAAGVLVLLDAKRGDVGSTNDAYAEAYLGPDAAIPVDALTVTPYLGFRALRSVFERASNAGAAIFVVTRSSNPEGRALQLAHVPDGRSVEQHRVVLAERELRRVVDDRHGQRHRARGRLEPQAVVSDRVVVRATRDEHHVVPALEQPPAEHRPDPTRAIDHEPHPCILASTSSHIRTG
jgi:orotidine-5'-phosphate decarboxylase